VYIGSIPIDNGAAEVALRNIKAALADISETEMTALIGATNGVPQIAPEPDP
jgi:hypothetical protein